jgi:hypothetical protein
VKINPFRKKGSHFFTIFEFFVLGGLKKNILNYLKKPSSHFIPKKIMKKK